MHSFFPFAAQRLHTVILCCLCWFAASAALAMQNEPRDFRGVPWGASLEEYKQGLTMIGGDQVLAHYRRDSDASAYGGVDTWRVSYRFYKNRFSGATIIIVGTSNLKSMLGYLTHTFGPAETVHAGHRIYAWTGEHAGITVSCDISMSCYVEFYDKEIRELELAEQGEVPGNAGRDD
jgi:hypothetical protein